MRSGNYFVGVRHTTRVAYVHASVHEEVFLEKDQLSDHRIRRYIDDGFMAAYSETSESALTSTAPYI
jgi:hypothetical protein